MKVLFVSVTQVTKTSVFVTGKNIAKIITLRFLIMTITILAGYVLATISTGCGIRFKFYRSYWKICAILLWSSLICLYVGDRFATIDQQRVLHEVGIILPIGAILLLIGAIGFFIISMLFLYRFRKIT